MGMVIQWKQMDELDARISTAGVVTGHEPVFDGERMRVNGHCLGGLVLKYWGPPKQAGTSVRWHDGNRSNNGIRNLRWGDKQESWYVRLRPCSLGGISWTQILWLERQRDLGIDALHLRYGVRLGRIRTVLDGKFNRGASKQAGGFRVKLCDREREEVRRLVDTGVASIHDIAEAYEITERQVRSIYRVEAH